MRTNLSEPTTSSPQRLSDLGIPRDRSARAQELARVPAEQFEAALHAPKPSARNIAALAPAKRAPWHGHASHSRAVGNADRPATNRSGSDERQTSEYAKGNLLSFSGNRSIMK